MSKAGDNEIKFRASISKKYGENHFNGKKRYTLKLDGHENVETSVDESIILPDGRIILIEVDSGNMAKLIAGQYALLNGLCNENREKTLFLVIHYYVDKKNKNKPYSANRTLKNLNAIQYFSPEKDWLQYNAFNISDLEEIIEECNTIAELTDKVWPNHYSAAQHKTNQYPNDKQPPYNPPTIQPNLSAHKHQTPNTKP